MERSPIYDELFSAGADIPWNSMRVHLRSISSLSAISEHRTLLSDLLIMRSGGETSYNWRDASGAVPFEDVPSRELEEAWEDLNSRVRAALRDLPSEGIEVFATRRGRWEGSGQSFYWASDDGIPRLGHALGRQFVSCAPVVNGVPSLLYDAYAEVTRGMDMFKSSGERPLPGFQEVWDVGAEAVNSTTPETDRADGSEKFVNAVCLMAAVISPPGSLDTGSLMMKVSSYFDKAVGAPERGVVVSSPISQSSPLFGTVISLSAEDTAWSARGLPPARLLELPNGLLCGCSRGSLILADPKGELYTPDPEATLTPNPLVRRALKEGWLTPTNVTVKDLEGFSSIWQLSAGGHLAPVTGLDGVPDLEGAQFARQGELIFSSLVERTHLL